MIIQTLSLLLPEEDLNLFLASRVPETIVLRDVRLQITRTGALIAGFYPTPLFKVRFETLWELGARGNQITARLTGLEVAGFPGGMGRGVLLDLLADSLRKHDGVRVDSDTLVVELDRLLARYGVAGQFNLTGVTCLEGHLLIEGGSAAPAGSA